MAFRDMEYDRPRLEEREIAFFPGRNLTERMKSAMRGFLHLTERDKSSVVGLAHFFECPGWWGQPRSFIASQASEGIPGTVAGRRLSRTMAPSRPRANAPRVEYRDHHPGCLAGD
jgi:hypothetical protein